MTVAIFNINIFPYNSARLKMFAFLNLLKGTYTWGKKNLTCLVFVEPLGELRHPCFPENYSSDSYMVAPSDLTCDQTVLPVHLQMV